MQKYIWYLAASVVYLMGCQQDPGTTKISSPRAEAESVFLTKDEHGNTVIAWTESDGGKTRFLYRDLNTVEEGDPVSVPVPNDMATHAEGMPKIAFLGNGTVIAAYETKAPTAANKYAGAIYFTQSVDHGRTWSAPSYIHSDTVAGRSRSFFDIERLPDGSVGASWLDIKLNKQKGGRAVKFARTTGDGRFSGEILIDSSACECCRIDVYSDEQDRVHVAYRGSAAGTMGQTIRDMMHVLSNDGGYTFSHPTTISKDHWIIDGCPHTGPALASTGKTLHAFWYTEGGSTGVFYTSKSSGEFNSRENVSLEGRHPQLAANGDVAALIWEEQIGSGATSVNTIRYQLRSPRGTTTFILTADSVDAYFPVISKHKNGFLAAYMAKENGKINVYTKEIGDQ